MRCSNLRAPAAGPLPAEIRQAPESRGPPIACSVDLERAIHNAQARPGVGGAVSCKRQPEGDPSAGCGDEEYKGEGQKKRAEECFHVGASRDVRRAAVSVLDNLEFGIRQNPSHEIEAGKKRRLGVLAGGGGARAGVSKGRARTPERPIPRATHPRDSRVRRQLSRSVL
jgi:hypothetical protein